VPVTLTTDDEWFASTVVYLYGIEATASLDDLKLVVWGEEVMDWKARPVTAEIHHNQHEKLVNLAEDGEDCPVRRWYVTDEEPVNVVGVNLTVDSNDDRSVGMDADKDGKADTSDFDSDDSLEHETEWVFWVNDNRDGLGAFDPPSGTDGMDDSVGGLMDLDDLAPVRIAVGGMAAIQTPKEWKLLLSLSQAGPEVRVFQHPGENTQHLRDRDVAAKAARQRGYSYRGSGSRGVVSSTAKLELNPEHVKPGNASDTERELWMLFEGVEASDGVCDFVFELADPSGRVVCSDRAKIKLVPSRDTYALIDAVKGAEGFSGGTPRPEWARSEDADVRTGTDPVTVAFHGYNNDRAQAQDWHRRVSRRLYWAGSRNKYVGVMWRGDELGPANFNRNVFNAFQAGPEVATFLKGQFSNERRLRFLGFSLGNLVASTAIWEVHPVDRLRDRSGIRPGAYVMCESAVVANAYDANYINPGVPLYDAMVSRAMRKGYGNDIAKGFMGGPLRYAMWKKYPQYVDSSTMGQPGHVPVEATYLEDGGRRVGDAWADVFAGVLQVGGTCVNTHTSRRYDRVAGHLWQVNACLNTGTSYATQRTHWASTRRWAEMSYWFPPLSFAAAVQSIPAMESCDVSGKGITSHSAMAALHCAHVIGFYEFVRSRLD
jgi:hypothetical protein